MRLLVPPGCPASIDAGDGRRAIEHAARVLRPDVRPSTALDVAGLARAGVPA